MPRSKGRIAYTAFGERLEAARVLHFDSAAAFARALGITPQRYGNWLIGTGHPDLVFLSRIRELTGVDLNFLITGVRSVAPVETAHLRKSFPSR